MKLPIKELIIFGITVSVMGIGGVHPWVNLVSSSIFIFTLILLLYKDWNERREKKFKLDLISIFLLTLTFITLIYLIPLPVKWLSLISQRYDDIWSGVLFPLNLNNNHGKLGLDPANISFEVVKLSGASALYILSFWWIRHNGTEEILVWIGLLGLAVVITGLFHYLAGIEKVFGLYQPKTIDISNLKDLRAPFLNANHEGGFLVLTSIVTLGLALEKQDRWLKGIYGLISGVLGLGVFLTLSRGAIASYICGIALLSILYQFKLKKERKGSLRQLAILFLSFSFALTSAIYLIWDTILKVYSQGDLYTKPKLWYNALKILNDFPLLGIGKGAFSTVFPYYCSVDRHTFTHPESFLVQILVDYGIIIGGIFIILLGYLIIKLPFRIRSKPKEIAAYSALVAMLIQNLTDFGIELPGIFFPVIALIAILSYRLSSHTIKISRSIMVTITSIITITNFWCGYHSIKGYLPEIDSKLVSVVYNKGTHSLPGEIEDLLKTSMLYHPSDYYIPYLGGVWSYYNYRETKLNPLKWFSRSLLLNPNWTIAHLYIGKILWYKGLKEQAKIEFATIVRMDEEVSKDLFTFLIKEKVEPKYIAELCKSKEQKLKLLPLLMESYVQHKEFDNAITIGRYLKESFPEKMEPKLELVKVWYISNKFKEAAKELNSISLEDAKKSKQLFKKFLVWQIRVLSYNEDREKVANKYIKLSLKHFINDMEVVEAVVEYYYRMGELENGLSILNIIRRKFNKMYQNQIDLWEARFLRRKKEYNKALNLYQRVYYNTGSPTALREMASLCEEEGNLQLALIYYKRLLEKFDSQDIREKIKELEKVIENQSIEQLIK